MARNSLEGDEYSNSSKSKSSAKFKAKFDIFLQRKSEVEAELGELLCSEIDDSVQPATLKLRATDLKDRLTSLGIANWINSDLDKIDPINLSSWEDQVSKNIAKILYRDKEKITIRKGLTQPGFTKRDPPKFNG